MTLGEVLCSAKIPSVLAMRWKCRVYFFVVPFRSDCPQPWCKLPPDHHILVKNRFSTNLGCAILNHVSARPLGSTLARLLRPSRW